MGFANKDILSVKDVSEYLGISMTGTYALFHSKGFPCFRVHGKGRGSLRIRKSQLDNFIESKEKSYERM